MGSLNILKVELRLILDMELVVLLLECLVTSLWSRIGTFFVWL